MIQTIIADGWQNIAVFVVLCGVIVWIVVRIFKVRKGGASGCCGCSLADSCNRKNLVEQKRRETSCTDRRSCCDGGGNGKKGGKDVGKAGKS